MIPTKAYAARSATTPVAPFDIERREAGEKDVQIEILYCGVCHSDLHQVRNEWGGTIFPCVPGHEIVGKVVKVGSGVTKFKEGDSVGVGCMVDSCRKCPSCKSHEEQYCDHGATFTYNSEDKMHGGITYGGYSERVTVDEDFVLSIPENLDLAGAAPLLCAGITTWSPLRQWKVGPGMKVGVVGLGGLGHMALKFAHAFGAKVTLFTTSPDKAEDAKRLGADDVVISKNADEMKAQAGSFDMILDAVSAEHDLNAYLELLKLDGVLHLVGVPAVPPQVEVFNLIGRRRILAGSLIGGIKETQAMLDFCGEHNITSDIEMIPIQQINEAYERMLKSDVKYRFVLDLASLKD